MTNPIDAKIGTSTGQLVSAFNPSPEQLNIQDIAHSLSNLCRWGGHCSPFFSVAQHSILVYELVENSAAKKWAFAHDFTECYCGDVVTPIKRCFSLFGKLENNSAVVIRDHFMIPYSDDIEKEVKNADRLAAYLESTALFDERSSWRRSHFPEFNGHMYDYFPDFRPMVPREANRLFLETFGRLFNNDEEDF